MQANRIVEAIEQGGRDEQMFRAPDGRLGVVHRVIVRLAAVPAGRHSPGGDPASPERFDPPTSGGLSDSSQ